MSTKTNRIKLQESNRPRQMLKMSVKNLQDIAFYEDMFYLCGVIKTKRSLIMSTSKLIGILFNFFYEMPSKALPVMAGLDRKVLNSRRITKRVAPSNPVFSRSFITSFGVATIEERNALA